MDERYQQNTADTFRQGEQAVPFYLCLCPDHELHSRENKVHQDNMIVEEEGRQAASSGGRHNLLEGEAQGDSLDSP